MHPIHRLLSALALTLLLATPAVARDAVPAQTPIIEHGTRFVPIVAQQGMVVGPERLAAEVGTDILRRGGNAVDAAVATGFALAVTYPRAGNLGGGGFMLIHLAADDRQTLIDYRETAPAAAHRDMFLNEEGKVDRQRILFSHQAAGVPGSVAGILYALDQYGSMSRQEVLAPAIALARQGFTVDYAHSNGLGARADQLRKNPEAARLLLRSDGSPYEIGETWRQPDLSWTLEQIANKGRDGFYKGEVAQRIATEMATNNGLITTADLAAYQVIEREPVRGKYRDFDVVSTPPPSSGGIHILQMLNILQGIDLSAMGHNSAAYIHHVTEAMKLAYADRSRFLGDPGFVDVPVKTLIDPDYASRQRKLINPKRATPSVEILPGKAMAAESQDTTHYSVADRHGNVVSNTYTLNFSFGSHIAVPGTGVLLNNEMADFAALPGTANPYGLVEGEANVVESGKRPLSSMSPTLVFRSGKPWLATGSPGGSRIITTVLQILLNTMEFDMNIAAAAASSRVHHQWLPDKLRVEEGVSPDTVRLLEAMGHKIESSKGPLGRSQSIMLENSWLLGASDTRRPGGWVAGY